MVPGFVAGDYSREDLAIDVVPLARRAGAAVVLAPALRIDANAKTIALSERPPLRYDLASLDVGSTVRGLSLPGVADYALCTRPIVSFVDELDRRIEELDKSPRIAVVGGGAAGVELCFTLESRLRKLGLQPELQLLTGDSHCLASYEEDVRRRIEEQADRRGIALETEALVVRVEADAVVTESKRFPADLCVWASGAAPISFIEESALPKDAAGFVRITSTLQVVDHPDLFAAGDCAQLDEAPWVPKAGVYAVRQGPFLSDNLRAAARGKHLRSYRPQRDFLSLINLGNRRALAAKWGRVSVGRSAWFLKDRIDRRFVRRFSLLDGLGAPTDALPSPEEMGMEEMECGGCAAKLGGDALARALARLPLAPPDPSVVKSLGDDAAWVTSDGGETTLHTVDAFRAFGDDPWLVGRVAAVNSISDIYACGGRPRHALAWVQLPEREGPAAEELLWQTLSGVRAALDAEEVSLVGGHTTHGDELVVGLSVSGDLAGLEPLAKSGARPGDALILTKALGTGVLLAADMKGLARGVWYREVVTSMLRSNASAARIARRFEATACTDISGFGLAVHLSEMLEAGGVGAALELEAFPLLDGARELLEAGIRSTFHPQNELRGASLAGRRDADHPILYDPQTSGGLLFAVPAERAAACVAALRAEGDFAANRVGTIRGESPGGARYDLGSS
jgi:selenide,water dikinase